MGAMKVVKHKPDLGETVCHSEIPGIEWHNVPAEGVVAMERILSRMINQLTDLGDENVQRKKGGGGTGAG